MILTSDWALHQSVKKLVVLLLLTVSLTSCASSISLFPVQDTDIYTKDNGDTCFSERYLDEVLQVKLKEF